MTQTLERIEKNKRNRKVKPQKYWLESAVLQFAVKILRLKLCGFNITYI